MTAMRMQLLQQQYLQQYATQHPVMLAQHAAFMQLQQQQQQQQLHTRTSPNMKRKRCFIISTHD